MQEVYDISRETMESLLGHLRNPSREHIERREMLMQRLQQEVQTVIEGDTETDQFEDLADTVPTRPVLDTPLLSRPVKWN